MGTLYVQNMTDRDATPPVKQSPIKARGVVRSDVGNILPLNASATAGTVYAFFRIPARARIVGIVQTNATMTTGAGDWGVYRTTRNGGTVVDADALSVNVTLTAQGTGWVQPTGAALSAGKRHMPLWQALNTVATGAGLTEALSDDEFDICFTLSTTIGTETELDASILYVLPE